MRGPTDLRGIVKPPVSHRRGRSAAVVGNVAGRATAGGHWWAIGHWALGLKELGFQVEVLGGASESDARMAAGADELGLAGAIRFSASPGPVNGDAISGRQPEPGWLFRVMGFADQPGEDSRSPFRPVFLDIDPGYPQMWRELGLTDMLAGHERFVTVGANVGRPDCAIPDCGVEWIHTPPPVDLDAWTPAWAGPQPPARSFTSVATWRNPYGTVAFGGATYGSRVHEFRRFLELPRLVGADFELALDVDAAETRDLHALEANGWRLVDPRRAAGTPQAYRDYIRGSRAELCIAQQMYVATRSGWLSDRSVCYLASGKPVLAQDTGLADHYPVGEGLLVFSTLEEAAAGVEEIERDYERHSAAARALAEEHFDARIVLGRLLERLALPVEAAA